MRWALLAFAAVFCLAAPASAHVTVSSDDAMPGDEAVLSFTVPTESATASTTALAVELPRFDDVAVRPHPGWTYTVQHTAAGYEVDWHAASAASAIKPGEFDVFEVSVGPLPHAESISFGAVQTYSDGTVVAWNQSPAPGSTVEPDHPKPTLRLTPIAAPRAPAPSTTAPTVLSILALVLAAAALGVAIVGNARRKT
jgi:uncharacterized protein YcnI